MDRSIGRILAKYRKDMGLSQRELAMRMQAQGCAVTNQALSRWEQNLAQPGAGQFMMLCRTLGIDDISRTFLGQSDPLLRELNDEGVKKVMEFADILRQSGLYSSTVLPKLRVLPLYTVENDTGADIFSGDDGYTPVKAGEDVPETADFGVLFYSGSMEPEIGRGQTVWVRSQNVVKNGEAGVFIYNGRVYLRRLVIDTEVLLHPVNPDFDDIQIDKMEELKIIGKILL